jgi:hypothetical protein
LIEVDESAVDEKSSAEKTTLQTKDDKGTVIVVPVELAEAIPG